MLALLQGSGQPVEPDQVRLVPALLLFQGLARLRQLPLARRALSLAGIELVLGCPALLLEGTLLLLEELLGAGVGFGMRGRLGLQGLGTLFYFLGVGLDLRPAGLRFLDLRVHQPFALLHLDGRAVHRLLEAGEPIPALAVAVVQLLAEGGEFLADGLRLLLLSRQLVHAGFQLAPLAGPSVSLL